MKILVASRKDRRNAKRPFCGPPMPTKEGYMEDIEKLKAYLDQLISEANEMQLRLLTIAAREILRKRT